MRKSYYSTHDLWHARLILESKDVVVTTIGDTGTVYAPCRLFTLEMVEWANAVVAYFEVFWKIARIYKRQSNNWYTAVKQIWSHAVQFRGIPLDAVRSLLVAVRRKVHKLTRKGTFNRILKSFYPKRGANELSGKSTFGGSVKLSNRCMAKADRYQVNWAS